MTIAPNEDLSRVGNIIAFVDEEQRKRMRAMQSFQFAHSLGNSPYFSLDSVKQIARTMLERGCFDQVFFTTGRPGAEACYSDEKRRQQVFDTLDALGSERAWLRLTRVDEAFPELKRIIDQFYSDLSVLYGFEIKPRVYKTLATLFVSSPGAVTPYHMDHTWNFLLQISGRKTVYLFDPLDPLVLSQQMLERFYVEQKKLERNPSAGEGIAFELEPGSCVHHPVNAPHWVQNGPQPSISLSLGLALHESNRAAKIHQFNYLLRRIGFDPTPPGKAQFPDALKVKFMELFSDRRPNSFDDIVYSGWRRLKRIQKGHFA